MVTVMKDNQRLRAQLLRETAPAAPKNNVENECDLFFLSMAKHVEKLRPDEQIKVKMEVSNVVLGAALQAAQSNSLQDDSHHLLAFHQHSPIPSHQSDLTLDSESSSSYSFQANQSHTNYTRL